MPAPVFIAKSTETFDSALTMDQPYMGSILAGDILFILAWSYHATGFSGSASFLTPLDWNHLGGSFYSDSGGNPHGDVRLFYKIADGSETGNVTITRGGGDAMHSQMYQYRSPTVFFDDIQANNGSATTMTFLALTLGGNARTLLAFYARRGTNGGIAPAISGYTSRAYDFGGVTVSHGLGVSDKVDASSDGAVTAAGDADGWVTIHIGSASPAGSNQIL